MFKDYLTIKKLGFVPSEKHIYYCFEEQYRRVCAAVLAYYDRQIQTAKAAPVSLAKITKEGVAVDGKCKNLKKFKKFFKNFLTAKNARQKIQTANMFFGKN